MNQEKKIIEHLFSEVGIRVNGHEQWDIEVKDERFYTRVLKDGSLGLGESYMEGWWDCPRIDEFICRLLKGNIERKLKRNLRTLLFLIVARIFNLQSPSRAGIIAQRHYDIGNDLFFSFLDPYNQYSCSYFHGTDDLTESQQKKLDLICRKIRLQLGDHILDIGCGWGGFARYAAEHYGCTVTAVNISEEQVQFAQEYCKDLPFTILCEDYRKVRGNFDKIVSIGMFEHVGVKNYRRFMELVYRSLKEKGIFLLHTIGSNVSRVNCDPWINRYIFPNGLLPSIAQIDKAAEKLFVIEDIHNLAPHYKKTLMCWNDRFQKACPGLSEKYDRIFKRMWEYYLLACAGAFCARQIQVWQIVMTKTGTDQPLCRFG